MKAQDVVTQLRGLLPGLTPEFTDSIDVKSIVATGTTLAVLCSEPHDLVVGQAVWISDAQFHLQITSPITRSGTVGTLTTTSDHDLTKPNVSVAGTERVGKTIEIAGATESEFNGTFDVLTIPNRRTITFTMADSGPVSSTGTLPNLPRLVGGSNTLTQAFDGIYAVTSKVSEAEFHVESTVSGLGTASGTITALTRPRISSAITLEAAQEAYTEQDEGKFWAFVVLEDVVPSKDRSTRTDAVATLGKGDEYVQVLLETFTVYVAIPMKTTIAGAQSRDLAQDIFRPICQSLLGHPFDSGLYDALGSQAVFLGHGFAGTDRATYWHRFTFEQHPDLLFEDTTGADLDVAFRDIDLSIGVDLDAEQGAPVDMTVGINLDDEPL